MGVRKKVALALFILALLVPSIAEFRIADTVGSNFKTLPSPISHSVSPAATDSIPISNSWTEKAPMPRALIGFGVAVVNGIIYVVGGSYEYGNATGIYSIITNETEAYDPTTDSWTAKTSIPIPAERFAVAVFENKIYVFGGTTYVPITQNNETSLMSTTMNFTQVYDPSVDAWTQKAPLPMNIDSGCANAVDDKIYLMGGQITVKDKNDPRVMETYVNNETEVYDPVLNSWTYKAPMPALATGFASAVVNGKIYVISGTRGLDYFLGASASNLTQIYDPKADKWSSGASVSLSVMGAAGCATTGVSAPQAIYVFGGFVADASQTGTGSLDAPTQVYVSQDNSWRTGASMPTPRFGLAVANVNDSLYVLGGVSGGNGLMGVSTANERYTPFSFLNIKISVGFPSILLYVIIAAVIASTAVATIVIVHSKKPNLSTWRKNTSIDIRNFSGAMKWAALCVVSSFASLFAVSFLSSTGIKWRIGITSIVSIDVYGAIIPVATACLFLVACLAYFRFSVRKYLVFLLFSIVLSMALTEVVRDSIVSASVTSPTLVVCGICGLAGFFFAFYNAGPQPRLRPVFLKEFQFTRTQFAHALLITSSSAAFSALFVDVIIGKYVGVYANVFVSAQYIGALGTADGILQYLIAAPLVTISITSGMFAVLSAVRTAAFEKPVMKNEIGLPNDSTEASDEDKRVLSDEGKAAFADDEKVERLTKREGGESRKLSGKIKRRILRRPRTAALAVLLVISLGLAAFEFSNASSLWSQATNLQTQLDSLRSILNFGKSFVVVNASDPILHHGLPSNVTSGVATWGLVANYSGYVYVQVETDAVTSAYVRVTYTSSGGASPHSVGFDQTVLIPPGGGWAIFPVLPSNDLEVTVGYNATLGRVMIVYYY